MKHRRLWIILGIALLGLTALVIVIPDWDEPSYNGVSLTGWVARYRPPVSDITDQKYVNAKEAAAIREIGTNAIPCLLKWIQTDEPEWVTRLRITTKNRLGINYFYMRGDLRAVNSMHAFRTLGTNAVFAIGDLLKLARNTNANSQQRFRAAASLGYMHQPEAIPPLIAMLQSNDAQSRSMAAYALAKAGELAKPALPALVACLKDKYDDVASRAAYALGDLCLCPETTVAALIDALGDSRQIVVCSAATSLGKFGAAAKPAVPALLKLLQSTDGYSRDLATAVIQKIAPEEHTP